MPGFLHVNRCPGIIPVWYSSLTPAFLWLPPGRIWLIPAQFGPVCHQPLPCASRLGSKPHQGVKTHFLPGAAEGKLLPTSCQLQALALLALPAQGSRTPGTPNRSLLQHPHSSSNPRPFPCPVTSDPHPPILGMGVLGRCSEHVWPQARRPPLPALHRGSKEPGYTTPNPSSVKHHEQQNLWTGSGAI